MAVRQLTEAQQRSYVDGGGVRCPGCGSDDIGAYGMVKTEAGIAWQRIRCEACRLEWDDVYTLTAIDEIDPDTLEPFVEAD